MLQAVGAEEAGAALHVGVDAQLAGFAAPGGGQALGDLLDGEAGQGGLVEVVQHLAVEAVAVDADRLEEALVEERADEVGHVILGGFEGEEGRRFVRLLETGLARDQRPEQVDHAARQPAGGEHADLPARGGLRGAQRVVVRPGQGALRDEDEDVRAGHAGIEQRQHARHARAGLAAAGGAFEEDARAGGLLDDLKLGGGEVHASSWVASE